MNWLDGKIEDVFSYFFLKNFPIFEIVLNFQKGGASSWGG